MRIKYNSDVAKTPILNTPTVYWDNELWGFGLLVHPNGERIFFVRYHRTGFEVELADAVVGDKTRTIGSFDNWSAEKAREEAERLLCNAWGCA